MGAVDLAVVPQRRKAFVVVGMEVSKEVDEGVPREGFAEVEVVDHDVRVRD